jgi:hypothetical protein
VGEGPGRDTRRRLGVSEAAAALGITVDAVRSRVKRNTIAYERVGGRVYVLLDTDQARPGHDQGRGQGATAEPKPRLGVAEDRTAELIATLQEQLQAERRANEENRRIIAALTQRIPEIEAPPQGTPPEPSEAPAEATEQPGRVGPQTEVEGPQEGTEPPQVLRDTPPSGAEPSEGEEVWLDAESSQEGTQNPQERRSWWRKLFGG